MNLKNKIKKIKETSKAISSSGQSMNQFIILYTLQNI